MFAFLVFEIIYNWDGSQQGFFGWDITLSKSLN
jgi:hypothetical protein